MISINYNQNCKANFHANAKIPTTPTTYSDSMYVCSGWYAELLMGQG